MDPAVVPERIEVLEGREVVITWVGGESLTLTAAQLRGACKCAECREEHGRRQTERVLSGPDPVTIESTRLVGNYAVNFGFGPDHHDTGIFPFPALRALDEDEE